MHKLISDLPANRFETRTRKAVTFEAKDHNFHLRRVIRYASDEWIRRGLLTGGSLPLSQSILNGFYAGKPAITESLVDFPLIRPILKFSVARHQNLYILTAIDEKNTDSYFLKTADWSQVRTALGSLTAGTVDLRTPAILEMYNPFALYAPFDKTPSEDDFESVNSRICRQLEEAIAEVQSTDCAGFLRGKILSEYNKILADLERVGTVASLLSTPSEDDFENDDVEK